MIEKKSFHLLEVKQDPQLQKGEKQDLGQGLLLEEIEHQDHLLIKGVESPDHPLIETINGQYLL